MCPPVAMNRHQPGFVRLLMSIGNAGRRRRPAPARRPSRTCAPHRDTLPIMKLGVNVPNFGPGTDPGVLREWARVAEGLGFDLLMVSDHVAVTPDVAERYPEPF